MKKIILCLIIAAVLLLGFFSYFKGRRFEVVITQPQIDTALAANFPASKKYLFIFTITYSNPEVTLLEEADRVQVGLDASLNIRINDEPRTLGGGATVTAGVRYDNETQEFYLNDTKFERLEIQGIPSIWLGKVSEVASLAAREYVETKAIYRLEATDMKTTAAKLLLKDLEVRHQAVYITLGL